MRIPVCPRPSGPQSGWLGPQQADNTHSPGIVINLAANTIIIEKADAFLVLHRPQVYQDLLNPILNDFWKWVGGRSHCHFTWRWYFHWVWMVELHKLYQRFEQMFYCFGKLLGCSESVSSLPGSLDSDISQSWPWGRNDTNTHQNYELN